MKTQVRKKCVHEGCGEWAVYTYDSRKEATRSPEASKDYRCTRHSNPEMVLGPGRIETTFEMIAQPHSATSNLFWNGESSFTHGPGFRAFANDFPAGTRLVVTARIEPAE